MFPTDTVYGLGASAARPEAVQRIYELKGRQDTKPLQVLIPDTASMARLARPTPAALRLAERYWPGPLTLVVATEDGGTVGLRVPGHPVALELVRAVGPIVATSANRAGEPTPTDVGPIRRIFGPSVDVYVDGGTVDGHPSTVVDLTGSELVVLREGAIPRAEIEGVIAPGGPIGAG